MKNLKTRKSKLSIPKYKKELSESSKNSSSEEIIEAGKEKNLRCVKLSNNEIFVKKSARIISDSSSSDISMESKSKSKTKSKTKLKNNNSKNNKNEYNNHKVKIKRKLLYDDNISEYEEEEEEEKNKKLPLKKNSKKNSFKKLRKEDLNNSLSSSSEKETKTKINRNNKNNADSSLEKKKKNIIVNDNKEEIEFLPCRENEQKQIYEYIKSGLYTKGSYSSLYIAGFPGTGKTVSVQTVIKVLTNESLKKKIPNFRYLFINGMKFTNISNVFKVIYNFIFEDKSNKLIKTYIQLLDSFFINRNNYDSKPELNDPSNSHIILIIDEVDCLINQKQNLLYNIFNWTTYSNSKLIVISISNTLDLPQRLIPKVQSRIGTNKLMFKAYLKEDLCKIISTKIEDINLFSEDALKISSMKVFDPVEETN